MSFLPPIVFAFYGSSLTTGRLSADWVPRLQQRLPAEPEALGEVVVYNLGRGSQTSDWGLANAPGVSALKPTHILFEGFAINDCAIGPVSLATAAANFSGMVAEWQANIPGVDLTHQTMSPAAASDVNRTNLQAYYDQELARAVLHDIPSLNHTPGWPAITEVNTQGALGFIYPIPSGFSAWGGSAFNPADKNADITLSNNNHTATSATLHKGVRSTQGRSSGKYYFETTVMVRATTGNHSGIATSAHTLASYLGFDATGYGYASSGSVFNNGSAVASYAALADNDVVSVAVDFSALKIWFAKNGTWQSGNPALGTGGIAINAATYLPAWSGAADDSIRANFDGVLFGGDSLHPLWSGVFETYSYPAILAWAKAKMGDFWS